MFLIVSIICCIIGIILVVTAKKIVKDTKSVYIIRFVGIIITILSLIIIYMLFSGIITLPLFKN